MKGVAWHDEVAGRGTAKAAASPAASVAVLVGVLAASLTAVPGLAFDGPVPSADAATTQGGAAKSAVVHVNTVENASSSTQTVVLTGGIGDAGTLVVAGPSSTVTLSKGTIVIDLSKGIGAENKLFGHLRTVVSPTTCSLDKSYTAPVAITSGTGAYAGITGTLVVRTTEVGVFPRTTSGACDLSSNAQPVGFLSLGEGSGTVKL
jgi:hypothetical protein